MTLLDISKIKDKETSSSKTPDPVPAQASSSSSSSTQVSDSENLKKVKGLLLDANKIYGTDIVQAEKKYDEIKEAYNSLSKEEKTKVYDDCMKLFDLLSK